MWQYPWTITAAAEGVSGTTGYFVWVFLWTLNTVIIALCDTRGSHFMICIATPHRLWHSSGLMLGHGLWRWPNIKPALGERLVFAEVPIFLSCPVCVASIYFWFNSISFKNTSYFENI